MHNYEEEEEEEEEVFEKGIEGGGGGEGEMKVDAEGSDTVPSASVAAPPSIIDVGAAVAVAVTVEPPVAVVDVKVEEVEVEEVVEGGAEVENEETAEGGEEDSQEEENDDTSPADSDNQQEQEPEEKAVEAPVMPVLPPRKTQGYGLGKGLALGFPKIREVIEGEGEGGGDTVRQSEQPGINPYPFSYSSQLSDSLYTSHMPASRVQDQPYVPGVGPGYTKGYGDPQVFAPGGGGGGGDGQHNLGFIPGSGVQSTGYAAVQNPSYGRGGLSGGGGGGGDVVQSLGHTQLQSQGQVQGPGQGQGQGLGQGQGPGLGSMES